MGCSAAQRSVAGPAFHAHPAKVLVAGGGIAGLELVLALRQLAADRVQITVLAPDDEFTYRPLLVAEPFGAGPAHRFPLAEILADQGVSHRWGALASVQPILHIVTTDSGDWLTYDALVVATGVRRLPAVAGALTFAGPADVRRLRGLVDRARRGEVRRIAFTLPDQPSQWPLPLYELALMTARSAQRTKIALATPERAPLDLFGERASQAVRERLEQAGIQLLTRATPLATSPGRLELADGRAIAADAVVALPRMEVPQMPGLPQDDAGFVPVDPFARVQGVSDVYAAGDVTDFRVKQGGFAAQQARLVAALIAARAGVELSPEALRPALHARLLTGAEPSYLETGAGASSTPLWWPPAKLADTYLVPYLISRYRLSVSERETGALGDIVATALSYDGTPARRPSQVASRA